MAMLADVSPLTILLSAGVSVVTGYVGTLLNFQRQRDRARRTYGLAILSEIKSLQRAFRQYHGVLGTEPASLRVERLPKLRLTNADLNVFGFNAGQIGLFSVRTAVEVIEFYSRVRGLIAQADDLRTRAAADTPDPGLAEELFDHLRSVVLVRQQGRAVAKLLRSELPPAPGDLLRNLRRCVRIGLMRRRAALRRMAGVAGPPVPMAVPAGAASGPQTAAPDR